MIGMIGALTGRDNMTTYINFTFENVRGQISVHPRATYVCWGGMGFHSTAAKGALAVAIAAAIAGSK